MTKLEVFKKLKEEIEKSGELPNGYYARRHSTGKECFCVVGHMLRLKGWEFDNLKKLEENEDDYLISTLWENRSDVKTDLESLGFDVEELQRMQILNDAYDGYNKVLSYINEQIEILEKE